MPKTKNFSIRLDIAMWEHFQKKHPNLDTPQKMVDHLLTQFWVATHSTKAGISTSVSAATVWSRENVSVSDGEPKKLSRTEQMKLLRDKG